MGVSEANAAFRESFQQKRGCISCPSFSGMDRKVQNLGFLRDSADNQETANRATSFDHPADFTAKAQTLKRIECPSRRLGRLSQDHFNRRRVSYFEFSHHVVHRVSGLVDGAA